MKFNGIAAASGTSTEQEMHPEYNNCTAFGLPANVNTVGCQYRFSANLNTVDIKGCGAGFIESDASNAFAHCHVNVANQTGINNQAFGNTGSTGAGTATMTEASNANNIVAVINVDNGICPLNHVNLPTTVNNGEYTGETGIMGTGTNTDTHIN